MGVFTSVFGYWLIIAKYRKLGIQIPRISGHGCRNGIMCIDCFCVLICSMGDILWLCEYMNDKMCI